MLDLQAPASGVDHREETDTFTELLLGRELYGHLVSLGLRPLSEGNDLAVLDGRRKVDELLAQLRTSPRVTFTDARLALMGSLLAHADAMPFREVARTVVGALGELFARRPVADGYLNLYEQSGWPPLAVDRAIVSIGPTIGIGDELLMAAAIAEQAARVGLTLEVETGRPGIWTPLGVRPLGAPPLVTGRRLAQLGPDARRRTMVLRGDFLPSDPAGLPWYLPDGIAATARWTFGNATATVVDAIHGAVRHIGYGPGLPESRALEARWVAARLLSGLDAASGAAAPRLVPARPPLAGTPVVLMQVLTSKPSLMLRPEFYAACLRTAAAELGWRPRIRLLAGPTPRARSLCVAVADAVALALPGGVELVGPLDFPAIRREIEEASVLVGPDTFTGHLAALAGLPQVTLQLPEHRAWANPGTPTFVIAIDGNDGAAVQAVARRLAFVLTSAIGERTPAERAWAAAWCSSLGRVRASIDSGIDAPPPPHPVDLQPLVDEVDRLRLDGRSPFRHLGDRGPRLQLHRYASALDAWRAAVGWYVDRACSDASGAAHVVDRCA